MSYIFYGLGALLLAILGFLFLRRRGEEEEEPAASEDVFADVELQDQTLEVEEPEATWEEPEQERRFATGLGLWKRWTPEGRAERMSSVRWPRWWRSS